MKKPILFVFLIFLAISCKKDDGPPPPKQDNVVENPQSGEDNPVDDPVETSITLSLAGLGNFDYSGITVLSSLGDAVIDSSGAFDNVEDMESELPLLFEEDQEILFGYYPILKDEKNVQVEDLLYFYFINLPDIAMLGQANAKIKAFIDGNSKKVDLENYIVQAINLKENPYKNQAFIDLLKEEAFLFSNNLSGKSLSNTSKTEINFSVEYGRDGEIRIPVNAPIFSAVAIQVRNISGDISVYSPKVLKTTKVPFSDSAISSFVRNVLTWNIFSAPGGEKVQLTDSGNYTIAFTNKMSGFPDLSPVVKEANKKYFVSFLINSMASGFNSMLSEGCTAKATETILDIEATYLEFETLDNKEFTDEQWDTIYFKLADHLSQVAAECLGANSKTASHLSKLFKHLAFLNKVARASEFVFFVRDVSLLRFAGADTKTFEDGTLYGKMNRNIVSDSVFEGKKDAKFLFSATFEELKPSYVVDRDKLTFEKIEEYVPAAELPISVKRIEGSLGGSGFVSNDMGIFNTNGVGGLFLEFNMGREDSAFEIKPELNLTEAQFKPIRVELKVEEENNEDDIKNLLESKNWSIVSDFSIVNSECYFTRTIECNDPLFEDNPQEGPNACRALNGIVFNSDGSFDVPFFGNEEGLTTSYSISGNTISLYLQINRTINNPDGSSQTNNINWSWQGTKNANNDFFVLQYSALEIGTSVNPAITCTTTYTNQGSRVMR